MRNIELIIKELIGSDSAISTEEGILVFKKIKQVLDSDNLSVDLNFKNISLITPSFLNASIGQLYSYYDSQTLNSKLKIQGLCADDLELLKLVIKRSKEYFKERHERFKNKDS